MDPVTLGSSVPLDAMVTGVEAATAGPTASPASGEGSVGRGQQGRDRDQTPVEDGSGNGPSALQLKKYF